MEPDRKTVPRHHLQPEYTLTVTGEPDEVESLAHSVDTLMTEIRAARRHVDGNRVAVLASLHLADACAPSNASSPISSEGRFKIPPVFPSSRSGVERPGLRRVRQGARNYRGATVSD